MCSVRSRQSFQLTAVSVSDHLRAFSMCLDSGICMATLIPYASSRLLLMDCVCLCLRARAPLRVLGVLDGGIRDGSSKRIYHRLCTYMRAFTPYSVMEDFNGLVFHHTVHMRRLLGPSAGCPAPPGAARNVLSWRPSHTKHAPHPSNANAATVERHTSPSPDSSSVTVPILFSGGDKEVLVSTVIVKVANIQFFPKPTRRSARTPRKQVTAPNTYHLKIMLPGRISGKIESENHM